MGIKFENFIKTQLKTDLPDIRPGDTVRVYQKIKEVIKKSKTSAEQEKERVQAFEGLVISQKHGKEIGATITVRRMISGVGVEKTFPIHSPILEKIEILKRGKVKRAKLYYLREAKGKKARLKRKEFTETVAEEKSEEKQVEVKPQPNK